MISGDGLQFATSVVKVLSEEVLKSSVVGERLGELIKGSLDLCSGLLGGPGNVSGVKIDEVRMTYMSTKVLESVNGLASWICLSMSPWQ